MDGLAATPNSGGREPKVSEDTLPDLYPILLERNEECSNEESLTLSRIAEIIEEEFDVSVSISSVQRYLEKADVSEQRLEQCVRKCDSENE